MKLIPRTSMLRVSLSQRHGASSRCGWRRPGDMGGSWEYIEQEARKADKGWSSILRVGRGANNSS